MVWQKAHYGVLRQLLALRTPAIAYQTRDRKTARSTSVPATPDLDPGYHTGPLSFLGAIEAIDRLLGQVR